MATDASARSAGAGSVGLSGYLSGTVTNAPMGVSFDDLWVGALRRSQR